MKECCTFLAQGIEVKSKLSLHSEGTLSLTYRLLAPERGLPTEDRVGLMAGLAKCKEKRAALSRMGKSKDDIVMPLLGRGIFRVQFLIDIKQWFFSVRCQNH